MRLLILILLSLFTFLTVQAQQVNNYFTYEFEEFEFPVFVRGNLDTGTLLLFVQGGPGETAIDFARSDYPRWKSTLEQDVAIAYYDQRGLNQAARKIDSTKITYDQYSRDIIAIGQELQQRYDTDIYLIGHSAGGQMVIHTLQNYQQQSSFIRGTILLNTPITSDFSPERWSHFRPLHLKNLARENVEQGVNISYWQDAHDWITAIGSITTPDQAQRWNQYMNSAFEPSKRKITPGMVFRVIFSRPYNPIKYLIRKDNERVYDLLWLDAKKLSEQQQNSFEDLSNIQTRVLLLTGRYDDIGLPEENRKAHDLIPQSRLVILSDAGHESFLDQPAAFHEALLRFISENL